MMAFFQRTLLFFGGLAVAIALGGCPQHIEKMAEEMIPPKDYKPIYMTSTIPLGKVIELHRKGGAGSIGTNGTAQGTTETGAATGATDTTPTGPIRMEIRSVDDRRYPDEVEMRAFVYDTAGRFVMGLAPPYFAGTGTYRNYWRTLVDSCGGIASTIDSFTVTEVRQDRRDPYAIAFVLDHSPSMGELRARKLQEAIRRVLGIIRKGDQVSVVKFTKDIHVEVPLTGDSALYKRKFKVDGLEGYGGGTAIYDGTLAGMEEVAKAPNQYRKAVILFTDGGDNSSSATADSVYKYAREKGVNIYTIANGPEVESDIMHDLASYTGGRYYRIYSSKEFPYVIADIYRGLSNYYRITYRPPECPGLHTATVSLTIPELDESRLLADGTYDRSLFTPFSGVGDIALVNIEFDYDKATIRPESMPRIQEIAGVMKSYPNILMEIRGHTDDRGGDEYNQHLSEQRARAVADALEDMGIAPARLTVKGFGESRPLAPNDSDENRRKNRRTEFVIVKK
jgi:VWFA-related protein